VSCSSSPCVPAHQVRLRPASVVRRIAVPISLFAGSSIANAHEVGEQDAAFVRTTNAPESIPFAYLGAKHMVTGYDHVLFLLGVIFLLRRAGEIALYVTLFAIGHSITLLAGVLGGFGMNAHLVDAAIGISIIYKAFDNLGGFQAMVGRRPDPRVMVFGFGLVHGLGLSTKLHELGLNPQGLVINLLSFNVGVELGQLLALTVMFLVLVFWRKNREPGAGSRVVNGILMTAGLVLTGLQITQYYYAAFPQGS